MLVARVAAKHYLSPGLQSRTWDAVAMAGPGPTKTESNFVSASEIRSAISSWLVAAVWCLMLAKLVLFYCYMVSSGRYAPVFALDAYLGVD